MCGAIHPILLLDEVGHCLGDESCPALRLVTHLLPLYNPENMVQFGLAPHHMPPWGMAPFLFLFFVSFWGGGGRGAKLMSGCDQSMCRPNQSNDDHGEKM